MACSFPSSSEQELSTLSVEKLVPPVKVLVKVGKHN